MSRNQTLQPGSVDQANRLITDFWCGHFTKSEYYPLVDKAYLLEDLRKRVDSPGDVAQKDTSLCGPACFIYVLLNTCPDLYVKLVLDLYQHGKTTLGRLQLVPSSKAGNVPPGMDAVDWIALSGMKTNYYHKDQQVAGITLPGTVEDWFTQIGFKYVVDETNLFSTKELDALLPMQQAFSSGYSVCLLVHAEAFDFGYERDRSLLPNHWVVLGSQVQIAKWDESKKVLGPYVFINQQLIAELKKELAEAKSKAREVAAQYERSEEPIECQHRIKFTVYS